MKYHSVYIFFHLLYLKYQIEEDSSIPLDNLRDGFYEYQDLINSGNNIYQELDFETEIEKVLEEFPSIFEIYDEEVSFTEDDPDALYDLIPEFLDDEPTSIDIYMEDFISNESIYHALKLKAPLEEMQSIFKTNMAIFPLYQLIAKLESEHKNTEAVRKLISFHVNNLKEFFRNADNTIRNKIRLCLAHYNNEYLSDEVEPNINDSWHIALLSDDPKIKTSLVYDKIFYLNDNEEEHEESEKFTENKDFAKREDYAVSSSEIPMGACYIDDEKVIFFSRYIIYLNNYLNTMPDSKEKTLLIERKYLLITLGDLENIEEYYLENGTLDDLTLPPFLKEWLNENSFSFLIANFEEIINNIRIPNEKVTSFKKSHLIINLLLLKCYLDLSINEKIKNELQAEITNPLVYKNPNYSIVTELIDNIIFPSKEIKRKRK